MANGLPVLVPPACLNGWADWLLGRVPQVTHTGPIAFLFMINDLLSDRHCAKFVDDTTVWELCEDRTATSEMAAIAAETEAWSLSMKYGAEWGQG